MEYMYVGMFFWQILEKIELLKIFTLKKIEQQIKVGVI